MKFQPIIEIFISLKNNKKNLSPIRHVSHHHHSIIWYSIYLMFLSHLDRMEMYKRQRQASLILPFVQQLSRIEQKKQICFFEIWEESCLFSKCVQICGSVCMRIKKEKRMSLLYICIFIFIWSVLLRKWWHHEPTKALTLDDDRQKCVLYTHIYVCVYIHKAQLFTVNYLLSTTIWYIVYIHDDRCIHIDIKGNKRQNKKEREILMAILLTLCP